MTPSLVRRRAWTDKFTVPPIESLLDEFSDELRPRIDELRAQIRTVKGVREQLSWRGIPWRWTLVYKLRGQPGHALAYLIVDPSAPRVSVPLTADQVCALELNTLSKAQGDALLDGTKVGSQLWASFEIGENSNAEDIMRMLRAAQSQPGAAQASSAGG